jgi:isoleucyl-tRNA synthetase
VHLALFPKAEDLGPAEPALVEDFKRLLVIRDIVLGSLESVRKEGKIGKSLEAHVEIVAPTQAKSILAKYVSSLKELLNVSKVSVESSHIEKGSGDAYRVTPAEDNALNAHIALATGQKCNRCWNYYPDDSPQHLRKFGPWENVCGRCADALTQMGYSGTPQ